MKTTKTKKPMLSVLAKQSPSHVPFWFMRQAGRYLPEYRELRANAGGFLNMAYNPDMASEITMQPIRRFEMDAAIIFSDILVIPHALGQHLEFVTGEGPKLNPLRTADDFKNLNLSNFDKTLEPVYQAIKQTSSTLKKEGYDQTTLIGFCGAPWTVACYVVEGKGSKDYLNIKKLSYSDPDTFKILIDLLVESSAKYLINQINAGAEVVQIFDSWAGALDVYNFQKWVIEPTREIIEIIRKTHPDTPIIGFPRCAGQNYLKYVQNTGVTAVGIDPSLDMEWAAKTIQPIVPVQGNLDPIALLAGGDYLERSAKSVLDNLSNGDFIFNLGHGINKDTPIKHVEQLVKIIKDYKR